MSARQRLDYIDGLKGLAIFGVMANHWITRFQGAPVEAFRYPYLHRVITGGQFGVLLFFLVSAFTLHRSSLRRFQTEPHPVASFYLRRFWRVVPLWFFAILLYAWHDGRPLEPFWCCFTFLCPFFGEVNRAHLFDPGWSLMAEEWFYLALPFLLMWGLNTKRLIGIAILAFGIRLAWFFSLDNSPFLFKFTNRELFPLAHWYCFALGMLLSEALKENSNLVTFLRNHLTWKLELGLILMIGAALGQGTWRYTDHYQALLMALIFILSYSPKTALGKLSRMPWLRTLGICCYSLYLFHPLVIDIARDLFLPLLTSLHFFDALPEEGFLVTFPIFVLAMFPLAMASQKYLEKPLLKVAKKCVSKVSLLDRINGQKNRFRGSVMIEKPTTT